jgi:hypothetical protein
MSIYGYGYRYPRRGRRAEVESYIKEPKDWAKAAIFNKAIASRKPWFRHLEVTGAYEKIGEILRKARETYEPVKPATEEEAKKKAKARERYLKRLQEEIAVLKKYQAEPGDLYTLYQSKKFAKDVPYQEAVEDEIEKLENEVAVLQGQAPKPTKRQGRIMQRREELQKLGKLKMI